MKIEFEHGGYEFKLDKNEEIYRIATDSLIEAKERFLKHMSSLVDREIDNQFNILREINNAINQDSKEEKQEVIM